LHFTNLSNLGVLHRTHVTGIKQTVFVSSTNRVRKMFSVALCKGKNHSTMDKFTCNNIRHDPKLNTVVSNVQGGQNSAVCCDENLQDNENEPACREKIIHEKSLVMMLPDLNCTLFIQPTTTTRWTNTAITCEKKQNMPQAYNRITY